MHIIFDSKCKRYFVLDTNDDVIFSATKWTICQDYIDDNKR